ncbi:Spy0128 family protein, partial [Bifidobacterium mizhiense]|uniref:Spy0128 family protein n=1 Tax=Bifidobacterium mizhiense TaxID=2879940 RepID=UPI001E3FC5C9
TEAGDYTYSVSEAQGSLPGITYDQKTHRITVHVTDDQQGQLQATIDGNNPTFTNTYQAKPAKPDDPGNSGEHAKPIPPVEPNKPGESNNAPSKPGQTSDSRKLAPRNQSSDDQAKPSADSQALAASGSDMVMPVALAIGTAVLGLALMCLLRHRRDQDADLG